MNKFYIAVAVVLVAAGAFFYFTSPEPAVAPEEPENEQPEVVAGGPFTVDGESWMRQREEDLGVQFEYRTSPDGYRLEERTPNPQDDPALERIFVLMLQEDYEELQESTEPREGPPAIVVHVFRNDENEFARQWADEHIQYSNINLAMSEIASTTVAGANAIRYRADGLYATDNVVIAHGGFIYAVSGAFIDEDSTIRRDFEPFLDSIMFVPAPGQE